VLSAHIATKLLPDMPRFLPVVVKIFDPTCTYYAGSKSGTWASQYQGFPQARITLVKRFASLNGFDAVLAALRHADAVWAGAEALNVLVKALCETIALVQDSLREELVATVARSLLTLSDEQLKRENTEVLHSLLRALGNAYSWVSPEQAAEQHPRGPGHGALAFQAFWLEYTLKSVNSGFLVVKVRPLASPPAFQPTSSGTTCSFVPRSSPDHRWPVPAPTSSCPVALRVGPGAGAHT